LVIFTISLFISGKLDSRRALGAALAVKKIAILPTLLTLGNGVCGFAAIIMASRITKIDPSAGLGNDHYYLSVAGCLVLVAMVFDALDGYVARLSRTASKFGTELDSLCDAISFGVAPAFLLWQLGRIYESRPLLGKAVIGIAALYMVCTILRLARYNIESTSDPNSQKRFRGLPSPGAAGCVGSLAILYGELPGRLLQFQKELGGDWLGVDLTVFRLALIIWALLGGLVISLLMVSRVPYPHVTKQVLRGKRHFSHLVQVILFAFIIVLLRDLALVLLFWIYALGVPLRYSLFRQVRRAPAPRLDETLPR
jgi:CDP-diacylglycerol--serine O-phosphatidyltransferase